VREQWQTEWLHGLADYFSNTLSQQLRMLLKQYQEHWLCSNALKIHTPFVQDEPQLADSKISNEQGKRLAEGQSA